jgi:hypothetical protein
VNAPTTIADRRASVATGVSPPNDGTTPAILPASRITGAPTAPASQENAIENPARERFRRAACVRPPDERDADPETLPASAIKLSGGNAGDTDVSDLAPREPCRVRILNVGRGRVVVAHAAGGSVAELGPSSYVEIVLDAAALLLVRQAVLMVTVALVLIGAGGAATHAAKSRGSCLDTANNATDFAIVPSHAANLASTPTP